MSRRAPKRNRTAGLPLRRGSLYPTELSGREHGIVANKGFLTILHSRKCIQTGSYGYRKVIGKTEGQDPYLVVGFTPTDTLSRCDGRERVTVAQPIDQQSAPSVESGALLGRVGELVELTHHSGEQHINVLGAQSVTGDSEAEAAVVRQNRNHDLRFGARSNRNNRH